MDEFEDQASDENETQTIEVEAAKPPPRPPMSGPLTMLAAPELEEVPDAKVDPRRKWLRSAAGSLRGQTFAEGLSNSLEAYTDQEGKDEALRVQYLQRALAAKQRNAQVLAQHQQRQAQAMAGWSDRLLSGAATVIDPSATGVNPAAVADVVGGLVSSGQVPAEIAQQFLQSLPKEPEVLQEHLTRMATARANPFGAFKAPVQKVVGEGQDLVSVGPDNKASVIHRGQSKQGEFMRMLEKLGIGPDTPEGRALISSWLRKQATHAPANQQTVITRQEGAEAKAVGEGFGKTFNQLQTDALQSQSRLNTFSRMEQLVKGVDTGRLTPTLTEIAALAEGFGMKLDPNLDRKQAYDSLVKEFALQARDPSGGAGMPGALSDRDREFLVKMAPGLEKTPGGNQLIIETHRRLARRSIEVARLASNYRRANGQLDEGFYDVLREFSDKNPLFQDVQRAGAPRSLNPDRIRELTQRGLQGGK